MDWTCTRLTTQHHERTQGRAALRAARQLIEHARTRRGRDNQDATTFRKPVYVGDVVCVYTDLIRIGTTSVAVHVQAWAIRSNEMKCSSRWASTR